MHLEILLAICLFPMSIFICNKRYLVEVLEIVER